MFNNTARGLHFKQKFNPKDGQYKFLVTELHRVDNKDVVVNYDIKLPEDAVAFYYVDDGFVLDVEDNSFQELKRKCETLGCEMYVYPKFKE